MVVAPFHPLPVPLAVEPAVLRFRIVAIPSLVDDPAPAGGAALGPIGVGPPAPTSIHRDRAGVQPRALGAVPLLRTGAGEPGGAGGIGVVALPGLQHGSRAAGHRAGGVHPVGPAAIN